MPRIRVSSALAIAILVGMGAANAQSGANTQTNTQDAQGREDAGNTSALPGDETRGPGGLGADRAGAKRAEHPALNKEQQSKIGSAIRQANIKPVEGLDLSLVVGATVPNSVQLVKVPDAVVAVLPQFRNYSFFIDEHQELVVVDPALKLIKAKVPISGEPVIRATSRTGAKTTEGSARDTETERKTRADRQPERATRQATDVDQPSDDTSSRGPAPSRRQRSRSTANGSNPGRTTEADATVGSDGPQTIEVQKPPTLSRRALAPMRSYRPVEPGPPPEPARPEDPGPFGMFGLFR